MNEKAKKDLLRRIPHALYVATSADSGRTAASTISWVTQASFTPPLLAAAIKRDSATWEVVSKSGGFVLNFLGEGQKDLAQKFFKHVERSGDSIAGVPCQDSPVLGFPFFPQMAGYVECRVRDRLDRGDHVLVLAEVVEAVQGPAPGTLRLSDTPWQYGG